MSSIPGRDEHNLSTVVQIGNFLAKNFFPTQTSFLGQIDAEKLKSENRFRFHSAKKKLCPFKKLHLLQNKI
jgi:hypothetical protein